jgi:hypothetical protein
MEELYFYLYLFWISTCRPQFEWICKVSSFFVISICCHITSLTVIGINIVPFFKCSVYMKLLPCMLLMRHEHFLRSLNS